MYVEFAILAAFIFSYSLISGRVDRSIITGPIIFVVAGLMLGPIGLGFFDGDVSRTTLRVLADLTLATILFIDAANADYRILRKDYRIPARMLLLGLPGTIFLGTVAAIFLFDGLSIAEAAILGTMLAATDAALGKAVVTNPSVPARLREGLNIESGLNDGLCVPFLLFFIAIAAGSVEHGAGGAGMALQLVAEELGIGLAIGIVVSLLGAILIRWSLSKGWIAAVWMQVTPVAMALTCFAIAQSVHGSGYIAAFSGGLTFGLMAKSKTHELVHAAEGVGETLALVTWMLFGAIVVGYAYEHFTFSMFIYVGFSLTLVRMIPIYLSFAGSEEKAPARLFLGWFGPRGLASVVFAIIVINSDVPNDGLLAMVVVLAVLCSLVLHGMSASPLAQRIAAIESDRTRGER